jgi:hypothetical protein
MLGGQRQRPLIHVPRAPLPRELVGEGEEPAHQPLPRADRLRAQPPSGLLRPPTLQHRLDHRFFRPQLDNPIHQLPARRTDQTDPPQPDSLRK